MTTRLQVGLERQVHQRARKRAADLGISLAEYIRRLLAADLASSSQDPDVSAIFDLGDSGGSDIRNEKARYLTDALNREHASRR